MIERDRNQFRQQQANLNARAEDVRWTFSENLNSLYQLSFLLARDHEKAERCFVAGLENLIRGNRAFNQWAYAWAKRIVIQNAIHEVKPRPRVDRFYSSPTVFPHGAKLSLPPGGHFEREAILGLEDFERFVFVMSVLDHYLENDCALFLDCSVLEIQEARTRAFEKLVDSLHMAFIHNEVVTQERSR